MFGTGGGEVEDGLIGGFAVFTLAEDLIFCGVFGV